MMPHRVPRRYAYLPSDRAYTCRHKPAAQPYDKGQAIAICLDLKRLAARMHWERGTGQAQGSLAKSVLPTRALLQPYGTAAAVLS